MAKKTEKLISVRVTAGQRVQYDQTIKMTRKQWEFIKQLPENKAASHLTEWLDLGNVLDADDIEDFEAEVVNGEGNPVKPLDAYGA